MKQPRVAVLVDADNAHGAHIERAMEEAARRGRIVLKRAFGRLPSINGHQETLVALGFTAEVVFPASGNGKNAADLMLAQYATRLAERRAVEAVVVVSSDGDFATLGAGLAEAGIAMVGVGREAASPALREACVVYLEVPDRPAVAASPALAGGISAKDAAKLRRVLDATLGTRGRASASTVGQVVSPAFGGNYKKHFSVKTLDHLLVRLGGYALEGEGSGREVVRQFSAAARPAASG